MATNTTATATNHTGNGSTTNFAISFTFLANAEIDVTVAGVLKTLDTHYTISGSTITFTSGNTPANGAAVKFQRDTNISTKKVDFTDGSVLTETDLDTNSDQVLFAQQEITDKLAGIEEGATGDQTNAEIRTAVEAASDSNVFTDADHSKLNAIEAAATADQTVSEIKSLIAGSPLDASHLAANSVDSSELVDGSVDTSHLSADCVTNAKIADNSIDSEHYVDGSIDTAHIGNLQVTTAKIADSNITTSKLNDASVTGAKIADGTINSAELATGAVTSDKIGNNHVITAKIADSNVTTAKIADSNVTTAKIADSNVTTAKIADDAVTNAKIVDDAITSAKIANDALTGSNMAAGTITSTKLADSAVITDKINDNAVTTGKIADAELKTLAGMQSGTASKLADSTALTSDIADLNQIDGLTKQTTISDSDASFPTSGAVVDYVAAQIAPIGGLEVIATDAAFPNTQPVAGVVISIADAGGLVVDGSGSSTTARTVGGATVTINNFASNFNSSTVDAGVAIMVSSTGAGNIYNYHKATLKEADLLSLSNDINDFAARYRVTTGEPASNNDEGDLIYDKNADKMKVFDSTTNAFKEVTSVGDFKFLFLCPAGGSGSPTINGSIATYDLREGSTSGAAASVTNAAQLLVSINGVVQKPNTGTSAPSEGFAMVDSNTIIFGSNLPTGSEVFVIQIGSAVSLQVPADNTVATAKIQNQGVTTAKIADGGVTTAKLAADAVNGTKIADNAVAAEHIAANAVGSSELADNAVDTAAIADDAVTNPKIATNAVNGDSIADGVITAAHLATNSVGGQEIQTNAVGSDEIADNAVDTNAIADQAVALSKLPHGTSSNDGKFLRANNGADPTFESVPASARNLLINGGMQVNQRRSSGNLDYYNPVTASIYTLDRWRVALGSGFDTDSMHITQESISAGDPPTLEGHTKSLKVDIGNTETPSADQNAGLQQLIEAQSLQHLGYGTSSAKTLTLSFWVKSNETGTYSLQVIQDDASKYVLFTYSVSVANTWQKKTITFAGNTANTISNNNGIGLYIIWHHAAGSNDIVSTTSTWTSGGAYKAATGQVNLYSNGDHYWELTGCQLEVGSEATDYDHESFGDTLVKCRRYFWKSFNYSEKRYRNQGNADSIFVPVVSGYNGGYRFQLQMRTAPTLTFYNPSADNTNSTSLGGCSTNRSTDNMISVEIGCVAGNHYTQLDADAEL